MSHTLNVARSVALDPPAALALWADPNRWSSFVEGFARLVERGQDWPAEGACVIWESGPGGRGRVTEKVTEASALAFATSVFESRLLGTQRVDLVPESATGGTRIELTLDYDLTTDVPWRGLFDLLFVRRTITEALTRTLARFAVEADEEVALRRGDQGGSAPGGLR